VARGGSERNNVVPGSALTGQPVLIGQCMDQPWQIELLGGLRIRRDGETIIRFRTQKTALLLAYLALHRNRPASREPLVELLWPGSSTAAGRRSLRVELAALRGQLEPPPVPRGRVLIACR